MSEGLPRAARPIHPVKPPRHLIEKHLSLLLTSIEDALQIDLVAGMVGQLPGAAARQLNELARRAVCRLIEFVECAFALAPRLHQARVL